MVEDHELLAAWMAATRKAKQPQAMYPHIGTLREFARHIWDLSRDSTRECPF